MIISLFERLKLKILKQQYKKRYGKDWKKYFLNPCRNAPNYMPIQFDGDELERAENWEKACESGFLSDFLDNL